MTKSRRTPKRRKTATASKPKAAPPPLVPCTECGKCCTYVAIEIDKPTSSLQNATMGLWYLYHEGTILHRDAGGDWVVQFESRCRNLTKDLRCGIYEVRPHICREFDEKHCEVNTGDDGQIFATPAQLLEYLRVERPRIHAKLAAGYARAEDLVPQPPRRRLPLAPATLSPS